MPDTSRRLPTERSLTALLAGLVALTPLSTDTLLPGLPRMAQAFGADVSRAQLIISGFLLGFAVAQLAYGPLSDRFGRRPVLLGGVGIYCVASLASAAAPSIAWLIGARLLQGIGACAGAVVVRASVRDVHAGVRAARTLSFINSGMALAPILAPFIGIGMLAWFDWRGIFAALAGISAVLLVASWGMLAETNIHLDSDAIRAGRLAGNYLVVLRHRAFMGYMLTLACATGGLFAFHSGAPFVLTGLFGLAPYQFGVAFALVMVGHILGSMLSGRLAVRLGIDRVLLLGLACSLLGGASMLALAWRGPMHVAAVVGPMAVVMFGNGMVIPTSAAGAILPFPRMAGAASALLGFLQMTVGSLGGIAMGRLHDGRPLPMAALVGGFGAAALAAFWLVIWRGGARHRPVGQED